MADSMDPKAVMMTTLSSGLISRSRVSSSCPRMPGRMRSVMTRSAPSSPVNERSAASAVSNPTAWYPDWVSISVRKVLSSRSSSTTTIRSGIDGRRAGDGGKGDAEARTGTRRGGPQHPDRSPMILDDAAGQGEAQPGAARLGGEKRLENAGQQIVGNAASVVGNLQRDVTLLGGHQGIGRVQPHGDPALAVVHLFQRMDRVEREVGQHLVQQIGVAPDPRLAGPFPHEMDSPAGELRAEEVGHAVHDPDQVHQPQPGFPPAGEIEPAADDGGDARDLIHDDPDVPLASLPGHV